MNTTHTNSLYITISIIIILFLFAPSINPPQAKERLIPEFDLEKTQTDDFTYQINSLKKSIYEDITHLVSHLGDPFPQSGNQINFYLRNNSSDNLILTDIVTDLDKELAHYNFSVENPEILYQQTIQKFSISDIPSGAHQYQLTFLFQKLHTRRKKEKENPTPIKRCTFLSDAYCLHQKSIIDKRVIKECPFHFSLKKNQTLPVIISFNDSSVPQIEALPAQTVEKLKIDLKIALGFYRNQKYLKCLWTLKTIEKNSIDFPHSDEVLFLRAECLFQQQIYTEATQAYQEFRKKFPQSRFIQQSLLRLLMINYLTQKYDDVIADINQFAHHLTEVTNRDPAQYIAAKSYYHKKCYDKAKQCLTYISQKSPYYSEALYLQTLCCLKKNQYSAAGKALKNIIRIAPSISSYQWMKKMDRILEHGTNINSLIQDTHFLLGKIHYQQKQNKKALQELEIIPAQSPFYSSALLVKGLIFIRLDKRKEIIKIVDELSQIKLEDRFLSDARFYLAHKLQQNGNYGKARIFYEDSIQRCREGYSAIKLLKNNSWELKNLLQAIITNNSIKPSSSALSCLYHEIPDYPKLKPALFYWNNLLKMEKTLYSLESLILQPVNNYQKKIQLVSQLRNNFGEEMSPHSQKNQKVLQIQKIYQQIKIKKEKISGIKKRLFSHLKNQVHASFDQIGNRLNEIQDRAKLEIMMVNLEKKFSPLAKKSDAEFIAVLQEVADAHESFLGKHSQGPYQDKILFQLAECYYQKSLIEFQIQLKNAEAKLNTVDFLIESKPNFDQAIEIYNKILLEFPKGNYREKTLYALAYAYQEQGAIILAKHIYQQLVSTFPQSPLLPEVSLRLGEISFDENKFVEAAQYYEKSYKFGKLPEQYQKNILYKLGWSYYQQKQYEKAFNIFISLTDQYLQSEKFSLVDEMIYQLAKIFSEYDSLENVKELHYIFKDKSYYFRILQQYSSILFDQGRIKDSINAYQWTIDQYPLHPFSPVLQSKIEKCYQVLDNPKAAHKARGKLVTLYGENTAWWQKNKDNKVRSKVSSLIDESIRNSTLYLIEENEYQESIAFYKKNLGYFPSKEQVYTIKFLLGECLFKSAQYGEALIEYEKTLQNKKFNQFDEDASYKKILCLRKIIDHKSKISSTTAKPSSKEWNPEEKKFIGACKYIFLTFPKHKHMPEVLYKMGELHFQKNQYTEAIESFTRITQHFPDNTIKLPALKMIAKIHFRQQQFDQAAKVYSQLVAEYDHIIEKMKNENNTKERSARRKAYEMIALSKFKAAESLKQKSPLKAAQRFEHAADTFPKIKIADEALFEAAFIYHTCEDNKKAQDIFSRILKRYPQSKYAPLSLTQIALYQEKNNQFLEAAQGYEKVYLNYPKYIDSSKALYKAGKLFEKLENWDKVIKIFSIYQSKFHPKPALDIECIFRRGFALMKSGDNVKADASFHCVVDMYKQYKQFDDTLMAYYAAQAQFFISESIFEKYTHCKIIDISDQGMQPKLTRLKKVIENYNKIADFAIAEWTTAAYFKMGQAMDIFAWDLSEHLPARRRPNDESFYLINIQLEQKIIEFLEKAVLFHQKNISLAQKSTIHDQWINKSQKHMTKDYWRMGQLNEKLYAFIKGAPIPEILSETEKQQYREALLSKALPYQNLAVKAYEKNTLAHKNNIPFNTFIAQCYKRLAVLNPKKYLRKEIKILAEDQSSLHYPKQLLLKE